MSGSVFGIATMGVVAVSGVVACWRRVRLRMLVVMVEERVDERDAIEGIGAMTGEEGVGDARS